MFCRSKLALGLLSGRYSHLATENNDTSTPSGITPHMFKYVVGKGHSEFSSKRQQDAQEFLLHVLNLIERNNARDKKSNPAECFKFNVEERFECDSTQKVKYSYKPEYTLSLNVPLEDATNQDEIREFEERKRKDEKITVDNIVRPKVPYSACFKLFENKEIISPFFSTAANSQTTATKYVFSYFVLKTTLNNVNVKLFLCFRTTRLATFPDYLIIHLKKFTVLQDWSYIKLDVSVDMPDILDLTHLRGKGLQANEELLPELRDQLQLTVNPIIFKQLLDMGFSNNVCHKALYYTKNSGLEDATNWVMEHMTDADFNDPFELPGLISNKNDNNFVPNPQVIDFVCTQKY